jgi:HAD superfamily hydrolase (TIGR01509 family)
MPAAPGITTFEAAAVVFDCDGVLADTEEHSWDGWRATLARHGAAVAPGDVEHLTGRSFAAIYDHYAAGSDLPPPEVFEAELHADVIERFAGLEAYPDVAGFLDELDALGFPLAVASSSSRDRLDLTLATIGHADRFVTTVAGDEVDHGKPAPDLYLTAARQLDVDPTRCLVIEDTDLGVRSAVGAGATVVAVRREHNGYMDFATPYVVDRLGRAALEVGGLRLRRAAA